MSDKVPFFWVCYDPGHGTNLWPTLSSVHGYGPSHSPGQPLLYKCMLPHEELEQIYKVDMFIRFIQTLYCPCPNCHWAEIGKGIYVKSTRVSHDTSRALGLAYRRSVGVIAYIPICLACMVSWTSNHYSKMHRKEEIEKN